MMNRAESVIRAFRAAKLGEGETLAVSTPDGHEVHFANVTVTDEGDSVDVHLDGVPRGGDPSFRVVNPPTLVPDPAGDHIVRGERFRFDPMTALAVVVAQAGGAAQKARSGRRMR